MSNQYASRKGSVLFLGVKKKSGREGLFLPVFRFFHVQNLLFTVIFFGFFDFFHACNFFSRALFGFFSRAKKRFHGQKCSEFSRASFFFSRALFKPTPPCCPTHPAPIQVKKKDNSLKILRKASRFASQIITWFLILGL